MTFDDHAIDWLAELLADAARAEIMPRFRRLGEGDVRQKTSAADLVTEADVNAERLITARLRERYPQAMIVGEEACSDNPALLQGLGDADLAFVVDPVDGTFNFASGVPLFGVMLSVVVKGETVAGIIHDPVGLADRRQGRWSPHTSRAWRVGEGARRGCRARLADDRFGFLAISGRAATLASGAQPDQDAVAVRLSLRGA